MIRPLTSAAPLSAGETARVLGFVEREISSDTERRLALTAAADHGHVRGSAVAAFFGAVQRMRSDTDRRLVLAQVPSAQLADPRIAAAFRRVAEGIGSERDRQLALRRLAGRP